MLKTTETTQGNRATLAAVGLVVVIGALLRLHNLGGESLWLDEADSWSKATDSLAGLIQRTADDGPPPLHVLVLAAAIKLFGDSEWSLRLPSAIFGVANIVALYWLGTITVGRTAALLGAILLALSPFHIAYSQEARMYSLLALAATIYAATCFHYLRAPSLPRGGWVCLAGLALVYSHPYGAFDWIAIAGAFAVFVLPVKSPPRTRLVWAASNVVVVAGFAPWAWILAGHAQEIAAHGFWIPPLTSASVLNELLNLTSGRPFAGVILIGVVLGCLGRLRGDVAVLCIWIIAPAAIGIVASILSTPIFIARYMIGSLPPLLLLSAFGWTRWAKDWRGAILSTAVVAIAGLALLRHNHFAKEDWRGVASFLDEREQPTDCVLVSSASLATPLKYYRRNSSCLWGPSKTDALPAEMPASVLFVVFRINNITPDRPVAFTDELRRRGWRELDRTDFYGLEVVTLSR